MDTDAARPLRALAAFTAAPPLGRPSPARARGRLDYSHSLRPEASALRSSLPRRPSGLGGRHPPPPLPASAVPPDVLPLPPSFSLAPRSVPSRPGAAAPVPPRRPSRPAVEVAPGVLNGWGAPGVQCAPGRPRCLLYGTVVPRCVDAAAILPSTHRLPSPAVAALRLRRGTFAAVSGLFMTSRASPVLPWLLVSARAAALLGRRAGHPLRGLGVVVPAEVALRPHPPSPRSPPFPGSIPGVLRLRSSSPAAPTKPWPRFAAPLLSQHC